jgi:hypothetical protein
MKRRYEIRFYYAGCWTAWYHSSEDFSFIKDKAITYVEIRERMTIAEAKKTFPDLKLD